MNEAKRHFLVNMLKLFDLGLVLLSFGLATILVASSDKGFSIAGFLSIRVKLSNFAVFATLLIVWHILFALSGLYESNRLSTNRTESLEVVQAVTLATACLTLFAEVFRIRFATPLFLVLFWVISTATVVTGRIVLRYMLGVIRSRGRNLRYILVLGTNRRAIDFARRIQAKPQLGYRVIGFVDDEWHGKREFVRTGYELSCTFEGLSEYLRRSVIDEVAIYLPLQSFYKHVAQVAALCEQHGITVRFDPDIFNLKIARPRAEDFIGDPHIASYSRAFEGWPFIIKRALDLLVSLCLLILLAPLFVIVGLLIKATSDGPIFFHQERVGRNKRRFLIYKFRSMVRDAENILPELEVLNEASGPVFKIENDPRLTPIGRILRRTSIDELPQLFNILKGDMSLVGPRPLPVRDYEGFNEDWQRRRFSILPGITCLWQVNGRSLISFEQWMKLDIQYMDEWSLWLDLKILARTIPAILKGSGAV